ncbi:MAG: hypothetical protein EOO56_01575 [Hymenobacter sp.]|nr:MAG: hypothetical protein EOO56_01575 [Hymenobacter sp.]
MPSLGSPASRTSFGTAGPARPGASGPKGPPRRVTWRSLNEGLIRKNIPASPPSLLPLRYAIYVRSFETSSWFARPFTSQGDGRGFSTKLGRATTARIHLKIQVELNPGWGKICLQTKSWFSATHQYNFPVYPFRFEQGGVAHPVHQTGIRSGTSGNTYWFRVQAAEPVIARLPVVGSMTPSISLHGSFSVRYANDTLFVYGQGLGDGFPDAEYFVVAARGKAVLLSTYKHPATASPLWDLPGERQVPLLEISASIDLACNRQFVWEWFLGHHYNKMGTRAIPLSLTH